MNSVGIHRALAMVLPQEGNLRPAAMETGLSPLSAGSFHCTAKARPQWCRIVNCKDCPYSSYPPEGHN